ncbi:histidinol dehydrogenase, partial [Oleiphilus sp. HI0125]
MLTIKRLSSKDSDFNDKLADLVAWDEALDESVHRTVKDIISDVRKRGDEAVLELTNRFDQVGASALSELEMPQSRLQEALEGLPTDQREALQQAAARVRSYHEKQAQGGSSWEFTE